MLPRDTEDITSQLNFKSICFTSRPFLEAQAQDTAKKGFLHNAIAITWGKFQ